MPPAWKRERIEAVLRKHQLPSHRCACSHGGVCSNVLDDLCALFPAEVLCRHCGVNPSHYCYTCWEQRDVPTPPSREELEKILLDYRPTFFQDDGNEVRVRNAVLDCLMAWASGQPSEPKTSQGKVSFLLNEYAGWAPHETNYGPCHNSDCFCKLPEKIDAVYQKAHAPRPQTESKL